MKITCSALLASAAMGAGVVLAAAPARAQETPPATLAQQTVVGAGAQNAQTTPTPDGQSEDVIVTAQKRAQTLINVPQSVSVVSGATLEAQQANNFQDYLKLVPGVQLDQATPGFGRLVFRGINTGGVGSTVGVYVDETPFGSSSSLVNGAILAGDFDTFDVARVEVLRGPQGTLYGASSMAGVLKFVTNAPQTDKIEVRARGGAEGVEGGGISYYGNAVVNLPLGDTLAFRASGTYRRDAGFIDSIGLKAADVFGNSFTTRTNADINRDKTYGGRASLLFEPSSRFSIRLNTDIQNIEANAPNTVDADPNTLKPLYGGPTQSQFISSTSKVNYRLYNGTINYNLGFATLTSSSSYSTLRQNFVTDTTFNLSGLVQYALNPVLKKLGLNGIGLYEYYLPQITSVDRFTQELRLASNTTGFFDYLIGGYYDHEKGLIDQSYHAVLPGTFTPAPLPNVISNLAQVNEATRYEEYAAFGNATLHFSRMLDLDLGGRYSHNNQTASQLASGVLAGTTVSNPNVRSSEDVFTWSAAPKLKLNDHATLYFRAAKGFRPGGPNIIPPNPPAGTPATFSSDSLISYEGGFKGETADRTFGLEVTGFHIDWSRIQLLAVINNFGVNINGGDARSDGVEAVTTLRPTAGLDLSLNGAFTRARLLQDAPAAVGGRAGDQLPFTPKYSIGANGDYNWSVGEHTNAFLGASLRFLSKQSGPFDATYRAANGRQRQIPSYDVVDLRGGLDFGRFVLEAYVKNLGNAEGITSVGTVTANNVPNLPNGAIATGIIRARTAGGSVTVKF